ncbi:hypothetical protein [Streptomyces ortus]|uniref:Uncharacterized protein n=1 Tax=Streptomyces ortus TaxID=2867268 RepID=A0ABT3UWG3_9ACTN|nr:hypothetical protein [Streptomyces ortus]MCX4231837.1 hypothetical protein [Streptomyces ortus]
MSVLLAALPDFLGGLAAAATLTACRWSMRALRSRAPRTDDDS